jgi:hypothetical protein
MALHLASGKTGFLKSRIDKPAKVMMVQQEVSESGMQDRLRRMLSESTFITEGRFFPINTTGSALKLTVSKDMKKVEDWINKKAPDVLILDPLFTFFLDELNQYKDVSRIVSLLMKLKVNNNLSLVVVHHFSNKEDADTPKSTSGRFLGHSILADSADIVIGLDFIHPRYKNQKLPLPYNHYAHIETNTRHQEWPGSYYIERGEDQLLFQCSTIWEEIGKKIIPGEIEGLLGVMGGEAPQEEVFKRLEAKAHRNTIRKAINEAIKQDRIEKGPIPGTHGKKIIRLKR